MAGEISSSDSEYCAAHGTETIARKHPNINATMVMVPRGSASPKVGIHQISSAEVRIAPRTEIGLRNCSLSEITPTTTSAAMLPSQNLAFMAAASPGE